ncbi:MAG: hypothetical protein WBD40_03280 [Tepidisphaeraceae bacterium]
MRVLVQRAMLLALTVVVAMFATASASLAADEGAYHKPSEQSFDMGKTFTYNGEQIAPAVAAEKQLSCNQEPTGTTCFDSQAEALAAGPNSGDAEIQAQSARKSRNAKRRASAALVCSANDGRPLVLFENTGESGWNVNMFTRQAWGNLGHPYFLNASSYRMGGHSGHMAENANGSGFWYPGGTGICDNADMTGWSPSWNDRISSRYRN